MFRGMTLEEAILQRINAIAVRDSRQPTMRRIRSVGAALPRQLIIGVRETPPTTIAMHSAQYICSMPIVAAILGLAAIVWGVIYARRGSLLVGCGLFIAVGYVFGHEFWNAKHRPAAGDARSPGARRSVGRTGDPVADRPAETCHMTGSDWMLLALLAVLIVKRGIERRREHRRRVIEMGPAAGQFHLAGGAVFHCPPHAVSRARLVVTARRFCRAGSLPWRDRACWKWLAGGRSCFRVTSPIPSLGIHFGRARGPDLNSASLGIYLTACFWCGWTLLGRSTRRWQQLAIAIVLPLMALGVFFTYTRSTWFGLAASGLVVLAIQIPRRLANAGVGCRRAGRIAGRCDVVEPRRRPEARRYGGGIRALGRSTHVVRVRFVADVSDHPVLGVGFGRFYDRKLPYLSDRSQPFELESIRPLHHHNTLLSVLTETGFVGFSMFAAVLIVWWRQAWSIVAKCCRIAVDACARRVDARALHQLPVFGRVPRSDAGAVAARVVVSVCGADG